MQKKTQRKKILVIELLNKLVSKRIPAIISDYTHINVERDKKFDNSAAYKL